LSGERFFGSKIRKTDLPNIPKRKKRRCGESQHKPSSGRRDYEEEGGLCRILFGGQDAVWSEQILRYFLVREIV